MTTTMQMAIIMSMANFSRDAKGNVIPFEYDHFEKLDIFKEYCPFCEQVSIDFYCWKTDRSDVSKLLKEKISINYDVVKHERFKDTK